MADMQRHGYREQFSIFGDPDAQDPDPEVRKRFLGKYQGTVVNNVDPLRQGRLFVRVTDATGLHSSSWAMPCVPVAGLLAGTYFIPAIGAGVWVEFQEGDPERPIWVGCFWGPGQVPALAQASATAAPGTMVITLETLTSGISVCDAPLPPGGNVNLHAGAGTFVTLGVDGVTITAPKVSIVTASFTVNGVAFSVGTP